jgi:hypothetical protein
VFSVSVLGLKRPRISLTGRAQFVGPSRLIVALAFLSFLCSFAGVGASAQQRPSPLDDPAFFPVGVWMQSPHNAARYKAAGINTYVALWEGPTPEKLGALKAAGLYAVTGQSDFALASPDNDVIVAWMHGDEPDNAQPRHLNLGFGQPVPPDEVVSDYEKIKQRDPSRPVFVNFGQGVAWDGWYGRGDRTNRPEDYPLYMKGADIVSFDIYPAVHGNPEVAGKLEFVARGVERLAGWASSDQTVWNIIEASRIGNLERKPTPHQIRAEAWMSLIHGSKGLVYFVHQFEPEFKEASLLDDGELLAAVTAINAQIQDLAPVLNSPTVDDVFTVSTEAGSAPVAAMVKQYGGALYLFTVGMADQPAEAMFTLRDGALLGGGPARASVIGEDRSIDLPASASGSVSFSDTFEPYGVHLYRID